MGSASETEYLCLLAGDLAYLSADDHATLHQQVEEVKRMLAALLKFHPGESARCKRSAFSLGVIVRFKPVEAEC